MAGKETLCYSYSVLVCNNDGHGGIGPEHPAGANCTFLYWVYKEACAGDDGGIPGGSGGGGGGTAPTPPCQGRNCPVPIITSPVLEEASPQKCKRISKQLEKFPSLKSKLVTLAITVTEPVENGIFIDAGANSSTPNPVATIPAGATGVIDIDFNPVEKYVMLAHTHNSPAESTYSVFSYDDLASIGRLIAGNDIAVSEFVFYVITADGTRYALTINDTTAFTNFFTYIDPNSPVGTLVDVPAMLKKQKIFIDYFDKGTGKIKINSNPTDDKKAFLNFMKEANLGISLFEVDNTFSTFTELTLDKAGTVVPKPCIE